MGMLLLVTPSCPILLSWTTSQVGAAFCISITRTRCGGIRWEAVYGTIQHNQVKQASLKWASDSKSSLKPQWHLPQATKSRWNNKWNIREAPWVYNLVNVLWRQQLSEKIHHHHLGLCWSKSRQANWMAAARNHSLGATHLLSLAGWSQIQGTALQLWGWAMEMATTHQVVR